MEFANQRPQGHPSSLTSETLNASSDVSFPQPFPSFQDRFPDALPTLTPSRNIRKLVIDSSVTVPPPLQPIRRKPLSKTASPIATRYSSGAYLSIARDLPKPEQRFSRSFSVDSPTIYEFAQAVPQHDQYPANPSAPSEIASTQSPSTRRSPRVGSSVPSMQANPAVTAGEVKHPSFQAHYPAGLQTRSTSGRSQPNGQATDDDPLAEVEADADDDPLSVLDGYGSDSDSSYNSSPNNMSAFVNRKPAPLQIGLGQNISSLSPTQTDARTRHTDKPLPRSPRSSKLGTFFGWGSPSPSATEFSDQGFSPLASPYALSRSNTYTDASPVTTVRPSSTQEESKARTGSDKSREHHESYLATPPAPTQSAPEQIEEMEDELKAISTELASSIRREMDLEDLVERLQAERENPSSTANKRTSDYFSDSGYSSAKFSDYGQSREEIEKIQRRAEQDTAQIRLELTTKLQDERSRRQQLDNQIKELSQKASQVDLAQANNSDTSDRVKELENTCEVLRRKLSEERMVKDNFEDLLSALKGELQNAANERDNLRDEIVPRLRARVEGLEGQAGELEKMTYESTKMQQELQSLQVENTTLKNAKSFASISEEPMSTPLSRLSRSSSITGPPSSFKMARAPGLSRSKSVKTTESREALSDRLKDVEEQRDALHRALKALLERQECQNRENDKRIRTLEAERERLLTTSPQKAGFVKEVSTLREEINVLRRRSEEALEQKWQVEKGLAGLKMDLDRAEQEISSLRSLLSEKDILIPESFARMSGSSDKDASPATSASLMEAFQDLQDSYTEALDRIKKLELGSSNDDTKIRIAMDKLEQALSSAVLERDLARQEAASYKVQLDELKAGEQMYLESEKALADELRESARRVEELAIQVRQQLATNQTLRQRLNETVSRRESDQRSHAQRITTMQARLRTLEEQLIAAQTASEDRIARHEEQMATLKESHNRQLSRLSAASGLRSPRVFPPKSPLSPIFANPARSPRLSTTRSGPAKSVADETQVTALKERVAELERALVTADFEMQEVVGRMNTAQIEVLTLQEEREAAVSQTRKLERELKAEKVKIFEDRFKSLSG
ncbi:uncharacterized protein BCR38DRAFT_525172 [Pseudomassariella vexata]|uniref:DUF7603 domain-containing protein n=1 Tax=Pseudomassariella vexata TaxID=1141098 RepID=A0A1Y2DSK5_9PEZI|nr:uncharacterized protein BCR38DRAFT_525172 [Pseudomassariella vexata]ORY62116.1 hypothetical protein BCR38DRAFT_525172 [Pseudomassariella vexata]